MTPPTLALLSFDGRLSASRYRQIQRNTTMIMLGVLVVCALAAAWMFQRGLGGWATLAFVPLIVAMGVTSTAQHIRRLHDLGLSGWWLLPMALGPYLIVFGGSWLIDHTAPFAVTVLTAAPFVALIGLLIWASLKLQYSKGQRTENRFGPPPQI